MNVESQNIRRPKEGSMEVALTEEIIGAAIEVHRYWGPGLYEEIYERSLCKELELRGIRHKRQIKLPLNYKGELIGDDLRLDVIIENRVIVEIKHVSEIAPVHMAQLMTYLRLTKRRVGLLINFNVTLLKDGVKRISL